MDSKGHPIFLAGDVGGTNTRLMLMEVKQIGTGDSQGWEEVTVAEKVYPSSKYHDLSSIILEFLHENKAKQGESSWPVAACLAVAGPVKDGRVKLTNLAWPDLYVPELQKELNIAALSLINDFVAVGYGLLALGPNDVKQLGPSNGSRPPIHSTLPKACIGAGTGLGQTYLTWDGQEYVVWPSEGGHVDFAAQNEVDFELMQHIKHVARVPRCSVERIVSGPAIPDIYDFYYQREVAKMPDLANTPAHKAIEEARAKHTDVSAVITTFARPFDAENKSITPDRLCQMAVDSFIRLYAAEAGNMALKTLPYGGFYIAGGIARKILWALERDNKFYDNFVNKGRMGSLLASIPLFVVTDKEVGLLGSRVICRRLLKRGISAAPASNILVHPVPAPPASTSPAPPRVVNTSESLPKASSVGLQPSSGEFHEDLVVKPPHSSFSSWSTWALVGGAVSLAAAAGYWLASTHNAAPRK